MTKNLKSEPVAKKISKGKKKVKVEDDENEDEDEENVGGSGERSVQED